MPILLSSYYERFESHDPEEDICEPDETGTRFENEPHTFRELIRLIERGGFSESSTYPASGDTREWLTAYETNDGTRDYYENGARENESLHYSRANPPRNAKYWRLAFKVCGIIRN